jgi:hypothetical protein
VRPVTERSFHGALPGEQVEGTSPWGRANERVPLRAILPDETDFHEVV